jgi:flagellar operon protein
MSNDMVNGVNVPFVPIVQNDDPLAGKKVGGKGEFDKIFQKELDKVKFSAHATKRLESRNIELSEDHMSKLSEAVGKAETKGAKDSLVMMDDTAFIVNIPNRTVVTTLSMQESKENVFTNIDSVVFAK